MNQVQQALPVGLKRWGLLACAIFAAAVAGYCIFITARWPFTRARVTQSLEESVASRVRVGSFRMQFFPAPGCVAEGITIIRAGVPLAKLGRLTIEDSWLSRLRLTHDILRMRLEGLRVTIPRHAPPPVKSSSSGGESSISALQADGAVLEFERSDDKGPLRFEFPQLRLRDVGKTRTIAFQITANQPVPPGIIETSGSFGPWKSGSTTPLSGSFRFRDAQLGAIHGIAGSLLSEGRFSGPLSRIEARGHADVRGFGISDNPNRVDLRAEYACIVDATNGNVTLQHVGAKFGGTALNVQGKIASSEGEKGKSARLRFESDGARIDDLLRLFSSAARPSLAGRMSLQADVVVPPGDGPFLKKLALDGSFGIERARFTSAATQQKVDELSARARGEKPKDDGPPPDPVGAHLGGSVSLRKGIANLTALTFRVPGANAGGAGTYNVITHRINVQGKISMDTGLAKAAGGIKSILLKPVELFLRKNRRGGSVVGVAITGTNSDPVFSLQLTK